VIDLRGLLPLSDIDGDACACVVVMYRAPAPTMRCSYGDGRSVRAAKRADGSSRV